MNSLPVTPANFWKRLDQLPRDVLVADYHVGPGWVNLFVIQEGRIERHRIPFPRWELPRLGRLSPNRTRGLGAPQPIGMPRNSALVEPLFDRPLEPRLVYLVPHGPLEHYPLHAVDVGGRALVDVCPTVYLPCLSMLPPPVWAPPGPRRALVMGNMTGDLAGAEQEAREVAAMLGTEPYLGQEATLERLFAEAPEKNLLHIAGHGFFDPSQPLSSGIPFPDGILSVRRIYDLRLNDCLVVLSGCVTGLGDERPGEGFSSLLGAFFSVGARGLLVSLWNVDDAATRRYMTELYGGVLERGINFPQSLQRAYLAVRQVAAAADPSSAPFYWAPFKPVGNW